ncbi:MAG TPA: hypothetical protein VL225_06070 [Vicinamibacterales bacterium]|nr:hypothetical protein [Vicinamibacterales bacterium]
MRRIFRAFFWMRWRVLVNSLERTGARDALERFSVAIDNLGPILALILLVPSSIALFVLGLTAGFGVATGSWLLPLEFVRYFLLLGLALTLIGPIVLPVRDGANAVRLLLLPIPRRVLYMAQVAGALADPWIALMVPVIVGVPIGLAVGLQLAAAAVAILAGLAFLLLVLGLTSLASSIIHLLLRDRRRGELVMLVMIVVLPLIGILPQFMIRSRDPNGRKLTRAERNALPPTRPAIIMTRLAPYVPSELYRRATLDGRNRAVDAVRPLAVLGLFVVVVQGAGFSAFRRVLDMPMSAGTRRASSFGGLWDRAIPGLTPAASAVALAQLRLALRSPRGRATMFTPMILPLLLGGLVFKGGGSHLPFLSGATPGLGLATFGCVMAILALLPLAMNQFAIDKAGFTRQMLLPLSIRELLAGKAVGNALIAAGPAAFCVLASAAVFPGGSPAMWAALPIALVAIYLLFAPAAAALSAIFPKVADLNSIGNNGNAHQAAGMLGMLCFAAAVVPCVLLTLIATRILRRPDLAPLLLLVWCAFAFGLSQLLFIPVRRLVASRCETLAQYY